MTPLDSFKGAVEVAVLPLFEKKLDDFGAKLPNGGLGYSKVPMGRYGLRTTALEHIREQVEYLCSSPALQTSNLIFTRRSRLCSPLAEIYSYISNYQSGR